MSKKSLKPQIVNHTNTITELSNARSVMGMMKNEASMNFPGQEDYRNQVIYTLLKWADEQEALDITTFCKLYKIPRRTFYQMYQDHTDFRELVDEAKLWIGARRREGALKRYYDKDVAFKDMYKYDPEFIEVDKYNQTLKGDSDQGQVINVYLPEIKKSDEVPMLESSVLQSELATKAIETTRSE